MLAMREVFDKVKAHLLTQGKRSTRNIQGAGTICAYRGDHGHKCAVGCLIADEAYTPNLEACPANYPIVRRALQESGIETTPEMSELLRLLQYIHDESSSDDWPAKLDLLYTLIFGPETP